MRIEDAKKAYSAQLNTLREQKHTLKELLKDNENNTAHHFDRVEISRELSITEAQYEATKEVMDSITATEALIHNAETARQQSEAAAETANEFGKILTIYRRIAAGALLHLAPDGLIAVEVGMGEAEAVAALFTAAGLYDVQIINDLYGVARIVSACRRSENHV